MPAIHLRGQDFDREVLQAKVPVLVDFYAQWCGPCKMVAPVVDEVADELGAAARVVKVDVDEAQQLAAKFGVMSIPTFLVFNGGKVVDQLVGALPKAQLLTKVKAHLS